MYSNDGIHSLEAEGGGGVEIFDEFSFEDV
jgi:hypothetical protein